MQTWKACLLALAVCLTAFGAYAVPREASGAPPLPASFSSAAPPERVYWNFRTEAAPPFYPELAEALLAHWSGRPEAGEEYEQAHTRLLSAAFGIATAIETEGALFGTGDYATQEEWETKHRLATLRTGYWLIALAQSETDWALMAKDGRCNDFAWRQKHGEKWCDSGVAFGYWQMHVDEQKRSGDPTGAELLDDDAVAAATAIRWLRETPTAWGSNRVQRARADAWFRKKHPEFECKPHGCE